MCSKNPWHVPMGVWTEAPSIIKERYAFREDIMQSLALETPSFGGKPNLWILRLQDTTTNDFKVLKIMVRSSELDFYQLLGQFHTKSKYLLYADLLHRGDVYDYILVPYHKLTLFDLVIKEKKLTLERSMRFMEQLAEATNIINMCGYVHCDIKPENILVNTNEDSIILFDFGSVAELKRTGDIARAGSAQYVPPEYYSSNTPLTYNYDIWSIGVTFFVCLYGQPPVMIKDIRERKLCIYWPSLSISHRQANTLITQMMRIQSVRRITLQIFLIELRKQIDDYNITNSSQIDESNN